ncbi:hypothetical protein PoB_001213000 [Plakobranchus ocellatus]|uniref:Secreted protein n=1 Tax=Plakobranchus ocellatus TaxID=259542 RepID=A0AAV3YR58_9GAST|nr:hypothetical protein PoB_001213000 [Plakobranchus ocellatus]
MSWVCLRPTYTTVVITGFLAIVRPSNDVWWEKHCDVRTSCPIPELQLHPAIPVIVQAYRQGCGKHCTHSMHITAWIIVAQGGLLQDHQLFSQAKRLP